MLQNNRGLCSECFDSISNPICVSCLGREIESWLVSIPNSEKVKKVIHSELRKIKRRIKDIGQTTFCVICGKNAEVCPFCFIDDIKRTLHKNKIRKKIIQEFELIFNYKDFGQF